MGESWKQDHVYARRPDLLDWHHLEEYRYNFVVAYHLESGRFHGILGFSSPGFFSKGHVGRDDLIWLMLWKVDPELTDSKSLGSQLLLFLRRHFKGSIFVAAGITPEVAHLYSSIGFQVTKMRQFYFLNRKFSKHEIVQHPVTPVSHYENPSLVRTGHRNYKLTEISTGDLPRFGPMVSNSNHSKDIDYVINRFGRHPVYEYRFFGLSSDQGDHCLLILRKIQVETAFCLRIVDFFGFVEPSIEIQDQFQLLVETENSEYVDFLMHGWSPEWLEHLGFVECNPTSFVPNFFEPIVRDFLEVSFTSFENRGVLITKGDADLDRPNAL